jgi:hypothetical protein
MRVLILCFHVCNPITMPGWQVPMQILAIKLIAFELAGEDRDRRETPVLSRLKIAFFALHKRAERDFGFASRILRPTQTQSALRTDTIVTDTIVTDTIVTDTIVTDSIVTDTRVTDCCYDYMYAEDRSDGAVCTYAIVTDCCCNVCICTYPIVADCWYDVCVHSGSQ